jgi:RNA polymerase sigma-70 factor (ECF subfamily)
MTREAFNEIIHKQNRRLFAIAFRILRNQEEAEDVVQDVFMKMWMMGNKLDEYNDTGALAVAMTRNSCIDMLRKWKHINDNDGSEILNPDPSPSPFEELVNTENEYIVGIIIEELPPRYRDLVQMREINGLSYEEIATQNNVNINTLRVTLSRARQMIKEKYLKYTNERGRAETTAK